MKHHLIPVVLTAAGLFFSASLSFAAGEKTDAPQAVSSKANAVPIIIHNNTTTKRKATANIKLVDINTAKKQELKKLPGISDAEADKMIAGRPFGSKTWLVTKNIIPMKTYQAVKGKIICKLTKKDIDKIEAQAARKNKKP
jgi:DNA uptake protein ComE-like DNA-binding protein